VLSAGMAAAAEWANDEIAAFFALVSRNRYRRST
jgi:hypothetical protein